MKLEQFRTLKKMTYQELSEFLEIPRSTVHNICHGVGNTTLQIARQITVKTAGEVSYSDLVD